jgi:hypothetical protein
MDRSGRDHFRDGGLAAARCHRPGCLPPYGRGVAGRSSNRGGPPFAREQHAPDGLVQSGGSGSHGRSVVQGHAALGRAFALPPDRVDAAREGDRAVLVMGDPRLICTARQKQLSPSNRLAGSATRSPWPVSVPWASMVCGRERSTASNGRARIAWMKMSPCRHLAASAGSQDQRSAPRRVLPLTRLLIAVCG